MGDLTKNISRHEVACRCGCGFDSIDWETVQVVQECCDHFAEQLGADRIVLHITSGCRCDSHNNMVGGSKNSSHKKARAIDFRIEFVPPADTYRYLNQKYPDRYGIGKYERFTHLDTRSDGPARW